MNVAEPPAAVPSGNDGFAHARRIAMGGAWTGGGWGLACALGAGIVATPVLAILWMALGPSTDAWAHLFSTRLGHYLWTTAKLSFGVAIGAATLGVATAWIVAMFDFPGRRVLQWALMLPLAAPAYIVAYALVDALEYAGPVQTAMRDLFGWTNARDYWFPEVRSMGGAIALMSFTLYPYVYLTTRTAFVEQSVCALEVARTLGRSPAAIFWRVALPAARPAIAVGVALTVMECLNDFGAVEFFGVRTLTTGLFDVWLTLGDRAAAAQIALSLLAVVALFVWIERRGRGARAYHQISGRHRALSRARLHGWRAAAATMICAAPVLIGFAAPAGRLAWNAAERLEAFVDPTFLSALTASLGLAGATAAVATAIGFVVAYGARVAPGRFTAVSARIAGFGYATPGAVLALGVLIPFAAFDNAVDAAMRETFGVSTGLVLTGGAAALVFAYSARFLALAHGAVEAGLSRVSPSLDMAARSLGVGPTASVARVHLPLVRGSLLTAAILVFVDVMKELPATLMLRPFDFETLATLAYRSASLEQLGDAAPAALAIVAAGVLPVALLSRAALGARPGQRDAA